MKIVKNLFEYENDVSSVVTIGKFDGIHMGHRKLIEETVRQTKERRKQGNVCQSVVFTFDISPQMILSKKERRAMLEEMEVDVLIECSFGPRIITTSAEDFVSDILAARLKTVSVITGEDFRFGYKRQGDTELLKKMGGTSGFRTFVIPEVTYEGRKISSSEIRGLIQEGRMEECGTLLGYPLFVSGQVIHGNQIGRTIGVPTANLIPGKSKLLPPNGVYFTESCIGGKLKRGITNIGTKPTVDGHFTGVETYYFDLSEDLYDRELTVSLRHFSRPEKKFDSLAELRDQISRDSENGRMFFRRMDES